MTATPDRAANQSRLIRAGFKPNPTRRPFQKQIVHRNPTAPFLPTAPRSRRRASAPSDARAPSLRPQDSLPSDGRHPDSHQPRLGAADSWKPNSHSSPTDPTSLIEPNPSRASGVRVRQPTPLRTPSPDTALEHVPSFIAQHPQYRRRLRSLSRSPPRRPIHPRTFFPTHEAPASLLPRPAGPLSTDEDREHDGNWIEAVNNSKRLRKKPRLLTTQPIDVDAESGAVEVDDVSIVSLTTKAASKPGKEARLLNKKPIDVDEVEVIDVEDSEVELVSPVPQQASELPSASPTPASDDAAATGSARV